MPPCNEHLLNAWTHPELVNTKEALYLLWFLKHYIFNKRSEIESQRSSIQPLGSPISWVSGLIILNGSHSLIANLVINYLGIEALVSLLHTHKNLTI